MHQPIAFIHLKTVASKLLYINIKNKEMLTHILSAK